MDSTTLMMLMGQLAPQTQGQMPGQMPPMTPPQRPQQGQMPPIQAAQGMSFAPQTRGQFIPPSPQPPPQQGGGMFGGGKFGIGQAIAAGLNGYLAGTRGPGQEAAMQNLQMMALLRQKQMERQQSLDDYNRKRADENTDWQSHYDYEIGHPKEGVGSEYERLLTAAGIMPGTDAYKTHVNAKVNQLENPMVMTPYGPMPYSAVNPTPPAAPVGKLTPINDGGPAPQTPGTFPY